MFPRTHITYESTKKSKESIASGKMEKEKSNKVIPIPASSVLVDPPGMLIEPSPSFGSKIKTKVIEATSKLGTKIKKSTLETTAKVSACVNKFCESDKIKKFKFKSSKKEPEADGVRDHESEVQYLTDYDTDYDSDNVSDTPPEEDYASNDPLEAHGKLAAADKNDGEK